MSLNTSKLSAYGILRASAFILARSCEATREWARSQNFLGARGKKWAAPTPNIPRFRIPPSTQTNVYILPTLKAEILSRFVRRFYLSFVTLQLGFLYIIWPSV